MKRSRKLFVPAAVIAIGVLTLVGCIYIPGGFQRPDGQPRPETRIGKPGSNKPLWIGRATREDVIRVLGSDFDAGSDEHTVRYHYKINTGTLLRICGYAFPISEDRHLRIDFDAEGRIKHYEVYKEPR
jgi:hypothetical protein